MGSTCRRPGVEAEVLKLGRRIRVLGAVVSLLLVLLRVSEFRLEAKPLPVMATDIIRSHHATARSSCCRPASTDAAATWLASSQICRGVETGMR
jgi:hypothetical protein